MLLPSLTVAILIIWYNSHRSGTMVEYLFPDYKYYMLLIVQNFLQVWNST